MAVAGDPAMARFSADAEHVRWLTARAARWIADRAPRRILDIGCGDGSLLMALARMVPDASLVGIDLSETNVAAARGAATHVDGDRVRIVQGDYLNFEDGPFDLLIASSSLQGIAVPAEQLAAKIVHDLGPRGLLIHVTPYRGSYNMVLNTSRRLLRALRGRATDWLVFTLARTMHRDQPEEKLRERVSYMYLVLQHDEDTLRQSLTSRGLRLVASEPAPHTSPGQPKHRFVVMSR